MSESESPERAAKTIRIGLVPVLVVIALVIGLGVWFALSQSTNSAAPAPAPSSSSSEAAPQPAPEPSESSTPTPTAKPLLPAEEELSRQLGGIEVTTFRSEAPGVPVPPTQANRFSGPYSPDLVADGVCAPFETADGWMSLAVTTNNETDGLVGVLNGC